MSVTKVIKKLEMQPRKQMCHQVDSPSRGDRATFAPRTGTKHVKLGTLSGRCGPRLRYNNNRNNAENLIINLKIIHLNIMKCILK